MEHYGKSNKRRRGRKIGFPTCNLKLNDYVIPRLGVYAVKVKSNNFSKNGIANVGYRPTLKDKIYCWKQIYLELIKIYIIK